MYDNYGEILDHPYEVWELSESEKKEYKKAVKILEKYNSYISSKEFYELRDENIDNSAKLREITNLGGAGVFFGCIWSLGLLYSVIFEKNNSLTIIWGILLFATFVYLGATVNKITNDTQK